MESEIARDWERMNHEIITEVVGLRSCFLRFGCHLPKERLPAITVEEE